MFKEKETQKTLKKEAGIQAKEILKDRFFFNFSSFLQTFIFVPKSLSQKWKKIKKIFNRKS